MTSWHSYPKVYNLGHPAIANLFQEPVIVEEKIDGSQFSFGIFEEGLRFKTKNKEFTTANTEQMFARAVESVLFIQPALTPGWTYRCEYLQKPRHNAITYSRVPHLNLILFDVNTGEETYLSRLPKQAEADRLGLECVPLLFSGMVPGIDQFMGLLQTESILGGSKIEGVVIKNYARFGVDGKALMGKHVQPSLREENALAQKVWVAQNRKTGRDVIQRIIETYRTEVRWAKAVRHLRDDGLLENSPRDIPAVLKGVSCDIAEECKEMILEAFWKWGWPQIHRGVTKGVADWYKNQLLESQFTTTESQGKEHTEKAK